MVQPANETPADSVKAPAGPSSAATGPDFKQALTTASGGNDEQSATSVPVRGGDKKNDKTDKAKVADTGLSLAVPQTMVAVVLPLPANVDLNVMAVPEGSVSADAQQSGSASVGSLKGGFATQKNLDESDVLPGTDAQTSPSAVETKSATPEGTDLPSVEPTASGAEISGKNTKNDAKISTATLPQPSENLKDKPFIAPDTSALLAVTMPTSTPVPAVAPGSIDLQTSTSVLAGGAQSSAASAASVEALARAQLSNAAVHDGSGKMASVKDGGERLNGLSTKEHSSSSELTAKRKGDADIDSLDKVTGQPGSQTPDGAMSQSGQGSSHPQASSDNASFQQVVQAVASPAVVTIPTVHAAVQNATGSAAPAQTQAASQSGPSSVAAAPATPSVNSAQLVQSMRQSEMRLGMHSTEFGSISINTSVSHQVLSAQISLEHPELGRALAMHLPSIEQKLGAAYGLNTKVEVRDSSTASYGNSSQQSDSQQNSQQQARGNRFGQSLGSGAAANSLMEQITAVATSPASIAASDARLDIRI